MVVFSDDTSDDHSVDTLEAKLKECMALQQELSKANNQLALNPRYIQKVSHKLLNASLINFNIIS